MDLLLSDPGIEGIAHPPAQVGVELTDKNPRLLGGDPPSSLSNPRHLAQPVFMGVRIEVRHLDPLYHYLALDVVLVSVLRLVLMKAVMIVDEVLITQVCGVTGLFDGTLGASPVYWGRCGLLHLDLNLGL